MNFGSNIKALRSEKGISQSKLAEKIGVHTNHLSRYERNIASPSIDVVQKMADIFGTSIDVIVFGKELNTDEAISDKELLSLFKKVQFLSDKKKDTVKDFLSAFVLKSNLQQQLT